MEVLTNVHLDWTEVATTLAATQFQLMIAGGEYTDMIFNASDGDYAAFVGFADKPTYIDTGFVIRQDFLDAVS